MTTAEVTPDRLRDAVLDTAADPGVARRVGEMRAHVRASGGAPRAADAIEGYLRETNTLFAPLYG